MNKKQNDLLQYLIKKKDVATSSEISTAIGVSVRSVKNYVNEINNMYTNKVILSSRNGYQINPHFSLSLFADYSVEVPQTNEERSFYIIKQLLLAQQQDMDLFELSDFLCISYSTVKLLISKMNKTYSGYHVSFSCENDKVTIEGEETDKRKLLSYIINEENKTSFVDVSVLKSYFNDNDIDLLTGIIKKCFKKYNYYINDFAMVNLLMHIIIIINSASRNNHLTSSSFTVQISNKDESELIDELCRQIEEAFFVSLNDIEKNEIYVLFKAYVNYSLPKTRADLVAVLGQEIVELCDFYVSEIKNKYLIDLSDENFLTPFALHIKNLLFRLMTNKTIPNSMAETIRLNSPVIYDVAVYMALDLSKRYGFQVSIDETAFLALHVGAEIERQNINQSKCPVVFICPNYRNLSTTILNKLLLNFSNQIKIIGSFTSEEEFRENKDSLEKHKHVMVFTVIPLKDEFLYKDEYGYDIVNMTSFNLESQYNMLQRRISNHQDAYSNYKLRNNFHFYFEEDLFFVNDRLANKSQVLSCLCDKLRLKNYIDDDFEANVYKRESAATTAFGNIAIPHSMEMDAVKTCVAVAISKEGIKWDNSVVNIVFLLSINKADKRSFRYLYESLISMFSEQDFVQEVKKCTSFRDFEQLVFTNLQENDF